MLVIQGTLRGSRADARYVGHRVQAMYQQEVPVTPAAAGDVLAAPDVRTAEVGPDNHFRLTLGGAGAVLEPVALQVLGPGGQVLFEQKYTLATLKTPLDLVVDPQPSPIITPLADPTSGQALKLIGRVLDKKGQQQASNLELVLWGKRSVPAAAPAPPFEVVLVTRTDGSGYFSDDYPRGTFTDAYGVVGAGDGLSSPVPLEGGAFPRQVILVVDLPPDALKADDCTCLSDTPRAPDPIDLVKSPETYSADLGGKCVELTIPNRALEEFSYYFVIRTTEPEIKGLHWQPPRPIPSFLLQKIGQLLRTSVDGAGRAGGMLTAVTPTPAATVSGTPSPGVSAGAPAPPAVPAGGTAPPGVPASGTPPPGVAAGGTPPPGVPAGGTPPPGVPAGGTTSPGMTGGSVAGALLDADVVRKQLILRNPEVVNLTQLTTASHLSVVGNTASILGILSRPPVPGRGPLTADNPAAWDEESTFYQAATIAHGHLLHFKQVWRADGYSLGDLLYSLPLAPGQKKQIVVIDFDRRQVAARAEQVTATDQLAGTTSRDRDITDIVNSTVSESSRGGSQANVSGGGGGIGGAYSTGAFGIIAGVGGGATNANSDAWQNSSRTIAGSSLQQIRDHTMQSASAVRGQRSTVIQTVQEGQATTVQTETVANNNHCHALTMEYFEVLRHLQVSQELADVQECLFIPLLMTTFDSAKALRWRQALRRFLRDPSLAGGFDALERIANNYLGVDFPMGRYADEVIQDLEGELLISFEFPRPADDPDAKFVQAHWDPLSFLLPGNALILWNDYLSQKAQAERDQVFAAQIAPRLAEAFISKMTFAYVDAAGVSTPIRLEPTLISSFVQGQPLYVTLRPTEAAMPPTTRSNAAQFKIMTSTNVPVDSKVLIHRGSVRYRTGHMAGALFQDGWIETALRTDSPAVIATPTNRWERRNPREEDSGLAHRLLAHLNENSEYYHKAIWWSMDADRRHMILDGFVAPNANGRSVASVVENRLIGIVGNSLVMPVAPGFHLDPTFRQDIEHPVDLLHLYAPNTPIPPVRVSVPTRGVFAEAVMGSCNSCEVKDDSLFWHWEESPTGDDPTAIQPVSTASRQTPPPALQPKPFPSPLVNLQNLASAPDPTGLAAALKLIATPNIFTNLTGLDANQKNALAAFQASLDTAKAFGGQAAALVQQKQLSQSIGSSLGAIKQAQKDGLISNADASDLADSALKGLVGAPRKPAQSLTDVPEVKSLLNKAANSPDSKVSLARASEQLEVSGAEGGTSAAASTAPPGTVSMPGSTAVDQVSQDIWNAHPEMQGKFANDIRQFVQQTLAQWDANPKAHKHFHEPGLDNYRRVYPAYLAIGIDDPAAYIAGHMALTTFLGIPVWVNVDIQPKLALAEGAITASNQNVGIIRAEGFVPRLQRGSSNLLSMHAVGRAIDLNPDTNIRLAGLPGLGAGNADQFFLVIKAVTGTDIRTTTDWPTLSAASTTFKATFNQVWVDQQVAKLAQAKVALQQTPGNTTLQQAVRDQDNLVTAIQKARAPLNQLALSGFLDLKQVVVDQMLASGFAWGGAWVSPAQHYLNKDYMHFEQGALGA